MTPPAKAPISTFALASPDGGLSGSILDLGATVHDLKVRRRDGTFQRVVLGLENPEDYPAHSPHMGAVAGRYGNRIGTGRFVLDGVSYQLPLNENGRTSLHGGGATGLGKSPWMVLHRDGASLTLAHHSPAGHNGYPGALTVTCRYMLAPPATLRLELWAVTDAPTVLNLCSHCYFKLDDSADILGHKLMVCANLFALLDADLIPNGALAPVAATPLDFRTLRVLGASGRVPVDNAFMLRRERCESTNETGRRPGLALAHAATLVSPVSRLALACWTTEPALQVYDGQKVSVSVPGHGGVRYGACAGLALEPQHMPDSPNLPHFPSTVLRPGGVYRQVSEFRFRDATSDEV